ncbi:MAG: patatin-like phospholipase family protein [Alphaproteobacteria bacterium]
MPQNVDETFDWNQFPALLLVLVLMFWIPVGVFKTPDVWNKKWKYWVWFILNLIPGNLFLFFLPFLGNLTWKATSRWKNKWRKWTARILICLPPLNPLLTPFFLRDEHFADLVKGSEHRLKEGEKQEKRESFKPLQYVASYYAAIVLLGLILVVFGRPPAIVVEPGQRVEQDLSEERKFISGNPNTRPDICVCLSGGGIRSAAFSLGVLHALYDLNILQNVEVISGVSGGTYALSWLVLQPYYASTAQSAQARDADDLGPTLASMFSKTGQFQQHLWQTSGFVEAQAVGFSAFNDIFLGQFLKSIQALAGVEPLGTNTRKLYAQQIQRTFHLHMKGTVEGSDPTATNELKLDKAVESLPTTLWAVQDVEFSILGRTSPVATESFLFKPTAPGLKEFLKSVSKRGKGSLPFPIFNASLKVQPDNALKDQIWPAHFEITPLGLGGPAVGYVSWDKLDSGSFSAIRSVNIAPAVSGAAISGYAQAGHWLLRFLVRLFNFDLGYYIRNVFKPRPQFIYLSDGGHSENLGLYALIRRKCQRIVAVDAEYEANATGRNATGYKFEGFTKLAKALEKEKNGETKIRWKGEDEKPSKEREFNPAKFDPAQPVLEGEVVYPDHIAPLVYIKLALDRRQSAKLPKEVKDYLREDKDMKFPHDPTTKQQYSPRQFQAYQSLGYDVTYRSGAIRHLIPKDRALNPRGDQ